jgi:hypothetical protein
MNSRNWSSISIHDSTGFIWQAEQSSLHWTLL